MHTKNKIVLVTGASRGIGASIAKLLLNNGYYVVMHYNNNQQKAIDIVNAYPKNHSLILKSDFTDSSGPKQLWENALDWKGKIDVLINNAAVMTALSIEDSLSHSHDIWDKTYQVNIRAVGDLCSFALNHFKKHKGGIIINMASRASFRGDAPEYIHYAASKGAIISLTRTIARGYAKDNILAYAIAPGLVQK